MVKMFRRMTILVAVLASPTLAIADDVATPDLESLMGSQPEGTVPVFAFTGPNTITSAKTLPEALGSLHYFPTHTVEAWGPDKQSIWLAGELLTPQMNGLPAPDAPVGMHAVVLYELDKKRTWHTVAWHISYVVDAAHQTAAQKQGITPTVLERATTGADDVAALFESTCGDPKVFAKTISDREDVVLFGSDATERTLGGAKVRARLATWSLAFKVRDGVRAGLTSSKTVGWVAANVDATSTKKPKDKPQPYRVFAIYEKQGTTWQLVNASFSVVTTHR